MKAVSTGSSSAEALRVLRDFPSGADASAEQLASALTTLAAEIDLRALPPAWWIDFDQAVRFNGLWWNVNPTKADTALRALLPEAWQWAIAVCSADGRRRDSALLDTRLPPGHPALLPLLVIRCSDWAEPVARRAERRLAEHLAEATPVDRARACATAWACEPRTRGTAASRLVTAGLDGAEPALWQHLLALPDHRTRRRALTEALQRNALDPTALVTLALTDPDVTVARRAAEHILLQLIPPIEAPLSPSALVAVVRLLTARIPQVRAAAVTVLRRGNRPDLAVPFLLDRSALVRETARWVLRSHGQDPATHCRALVSVPGTTVSYGAVSGLAECADSSDVPWLRLQSASPRAKVRAAALRALTTLAPLSSAELLLLLEQDRSPSVGRAVIDALESGVRCLPHSRLRTWLNPETPPELRKRAAALLRASDPWTRLETDLQLITDPDPGLSRTAMVDLRHWAALAPLGHGTPPPEQTATIDALLTPASDLLDTRTLAQLRSRMPK